MPSLNKVVLIGRLTRDPELRYTSAGLAVASFSIAVDRVAKNQDGTKKTDFFRCNAWRQKAEFVSNYIQKGRLVAVDGRIELNEYTDKDGLKRFSTDIVCDNVELLDSNRDSPEEAATGGGYGGGRAPQGQPADDGYFADEEPAPAPRRAAAPQPAAAPRQAPQTQRPAAPPVAAARPAARPAPKPEPAYTDDDFDDSDPFADE
jgi:single-strand DNA-binding protein